MRIIKEIKELLYLKIQSFTDDRGLLIPMTDEISGELIKRAYYVENYGRNVIRGLHYHRKEIKNFTLFSSLCKFITFKSTYEIGPKESFKGN